MYAWFSSVESSCWSNGYFSSVSFYSYTETYRKLQIYGRICELILIVCSLYNIVVPHDCIGDTFPQPVKERNR